MIRPISYGEILDARLLLSEYSAECSIPELGPTNPQRDMYSKMESSGLMRSFGVFDDALLVGFATVLTFVLPHYGKKIANVESLFVTAERRGTFGRKLMEYIETFAKEADCVGLLYNARAGSSLERLLGSLPRYQRTNSVFLWSID